MKIIADPYGSEPKLLAPGTTVRFQFDGGRHIDVAVTDWNTLRVRTDGFHGAMRIYPYSANVVEVDTGENH